MSRVGLAFRKVHELHKKGVVIKRRMDVGEAKGPCSRKVPNPEYQLSEREEQREDKGSPKGVTLTCSRCEVTQPRCVLQTLRTKLNIWNTEHLETVDMKVLINWKDHSHFKAHSIHLVAQATGDLNFIPGPFLSVTLPLQAYCPHSCPLYLL